MAGKNKTPITKEQFEEICVDIETHEFGIKTICKNNGISDHSFYEYIWTIGDEAERRYARAKERQADYIAANMLEIADDASNDFMTIVKGDIEYQKENKEVTNRSRLRIDTRKWLLSKLLPKKYGDKLDLTTNGEKINDKKLTDKELTIIANALDAANNNIAGNNNDFNTSRPNT